MIVIATFFRNLQTVKVFAGPLSKKHRFRATLDSQMLKGPKLFLNLHENTDNIFSSLRENLIWEILPLVISLILAVFRNTLSANDKHPAQDCENFLSLIQKKYPQNSSYFIS